MLRLSRRMETVGSSTYTAANLVSRDLFSSTISTTKVDSVCNTYEGNDSGAEPPKLTTNKANAKSVNYSTSVHVNLIETSRSHHSCVF